MKNKIVLFLLVAFGCLLALPGRADEQSDAVIRRKLIGFWRSPRHEYEFKSDGIIYMLPISPDATKSTWKVKGGIFFWDGDPSIIVSLTADRFVYKDQGGKAPQSFILKRITKKMVGQPYARESIR